MDWHIFRFSFAAFGKETFKSGVHFLGKGIYNRENAGLFFCQNGQGRPMNHVAIRYL